MSHDDKRSHQIRRRPYSRLQVLLWAVLAVFLALSTVAVDAQTFGWRRSITVDRTKVRNPATLPIAFDAVTSAKTADAGAASLSWSHTIGSGNDKIAIVSVSSKRDASGAVTFDTSAVNHTTPTGSTLSASHIVGSGSNRLALVSVATRPYSVAFDYSNSGNTGANAVNTVTWTHTVAAGSNRLLIVGVSVRSSTGQTVGTITYNTTQSLTFINASSTTNCRVEMWYLVNPAVATNAPIVVTLAASATARMVGGSASFFNVDQTTPLGTYAGASSPSGTAGTRYVDVSTSGPGGMVIDTLAQLNSAETSTPDASQTLRWTNVTTNATTTNNIRGCGSTKPTDNTGTTRMQWTISGTPGWALGAVPIRPARAMISQVTYAGTDITANLIGTATSPNNTSVSMYYRLSPPNATNTVQVTLSASTWFVIAAASFSGVHQTTPFGTFQGAGGYSQTASVTVSSAASEVVVDALALQDDNLSGNPTSPQTQRWGDWTLVGTNGLNNYGSSRTGASSTTMSWAIVDSVPNPATSNWAIGAVPLKPASAAVTITQVMFGATNITANLIGTALNTSNCEVSMYYLLNPPAGTSTVTVTQSASVRFVAGAISLFNVSQTTPFGTFASDTRSGNGGDFEIFSVASAYGEIVVAALAKTYNDAVAQRAQNQQADRWNLWTSDATPANNILGIGTLRGGDTTAELHWDLAAGGASGQQMAFGGVSVKPTTVAPPLITSFTDYPLLVSLLDSTLKDAAHGGHVQNPNGYDIVFRASDGVTPLNHELEKYDGINGQVVAWVKLPSVNGAGAASDTQIYIYYGNPAITSPTHNKTAVWDANYMEVWHLAESGGYATDSTSHNYVGSITNDPNVSRQAAKIGGGYHFGGSSYIVTNDGTFATNAPLTMEAWFYLDSAPQTWVGIVTKNRDVQPCTAGQPPCHWAGVATGNNGEMAYYWDWHTQGNQDTGPVLAAATWYHAVLTFDGGIRTAYRNGVRDTIVTAPNPSPGVYDSLTMPSRINQDMLGSGMGTDIIDEVRISTVARTPAWILTSYDNMNNPGNIGTPGFYTVGAEGPTALYRSVGTNGANLNSGGPTVTISGTTATFSGAMPNNVGVGDALTYTSGTAQLAFISGRTSSTVFTVQDKIGGTPTAVSGATVGVYRAYTSLANWQSRTENPLINEPVENDVNPSQDLVSANTIMNVACYGDSGDTAAVTINGWTTGAANYIDIFAPNLPSEVGATQRHNGKWDATKYQLVAALDYHGVIWISDEYVRVTGLQIENTGPKGNRPQGIEIDPGSATSEVRLSHNILRSTGTGTGDWWCAAIGQTNVGGVVKAWNNTMYNWGAGFFCDYASTSSGVTLYNNTVVSSDNVGIELGGHASGTYRLANNLVQGAATNYYFAAGVLPLTYSATNLSQDATSPNGASFQNKTVTFVGAADFHLASTDTNAKDQGTSLSSDPSSAFSDDIDGQGRPYGSAWDIGADEYGSGLFSYRRLITILNTMTPGTCSSDLANFPVLVSITNDPNLKTVANGGHVQNANGYDIIFRALDGQTQLDHEIESYVGVNGTLVAWVRIPTLAYNADTTIYMYYGNAGITSPAANPTGVWNTANGWRGVWHMNEASSATRNDSTSNVNNLSQTGSVPLATGKIAGAASFDGTSQYLSRADGGVGTSLDITGSLTVEAWVSMAATQTDTGYILNKWRGTCGATTNPPYYLRNNNLTPPYRETLQFAHTCGPIVCTGPDCVTGTGPASMNASTFYHLVGVYDGSNMTVYRDGSLVAGPTAFTLGPYDSDGALYVGIREGTQQRFTGLVDELRLSAVARDACWIGTEYNNQSTPGMVVTAGSGMAVRTGSYTGDGLDNKQITGLGFKPDIVIIKGNVAQDPVCTTSSMPAYSAKALGSTAGALAANAIKSLGTDGFTLGTDARVNTNGSVYYWVAFEAGAGELKVGSYQGNGAARSITGVGFQPDWVVVMSSAANLSRHRSATMPNTAYFHDQFSDSTGITALGTDGFSVDTDATVNTNGTTYHYFAFKKVPGKMNEGSYPGTGVAKSITGVGFQPEYVLVRTSTVTAGQRAVARTVSLSGDSSLNFGLIPNEANHIQALLTDGFQVGTSNRVNVSPNTYHWVAFGPSASVGTEQPAGPTAVRLTSFTAPEYSGGVLLKWDTGYEVDNLGFHVYREVNGQQVRVTPGLVAGSALFAGAGTPLTAGRSYSWWDSSPVPGASYWLEEWELSGEKRWHGPVMAQPATDEESGAMAATSSVLLSGLGAPVHPVTKVVRRHLAVSEGAVAGPSEGPRTIPGAVTPEIEQQWRVVAGRAVKIVVRETGWYRVSQEELAAAGFDPGFDPSKLQLFCDGQQVPIVLNWGRNGRFRPGDSIEFYGVGLDTVSTAERVYWLVAGASVGKRIAVESGVGGWSAGPASFPYEVERADRTLYFPALINGDEDNFFGAVIEATPVDQTVRVTHLDPGGQAELAVRLQGGTQGPHQVGVELNGVRVGTLTWDGLTTGELAVPLGPGMVVEGDNVVTLAAEGGQGDVSVVESIRIRYAHTWEAEGDALACTLDGFQQVTIDGFASEKVRVFDVTSPQAVEQVTGVVTPSGGGYAIEFGAPEAGTRTLLVVGESAVRRAVAVTANRASAWHAASAGADLVIIGHRSLLAGLEPLRALRTAQGLKVAVVDVEDVYDEFSFGAKSPQAIRDCMAWAGTNWLRKPRYLLLVGSASYDPRGYLGLAGGDLVPVKLVGTTYLETASDDWFVDLNGDGIEDLAVGRLPVATPAEAAALVAKIVAYDRTSAAKKVLLVADANDAGNDFEALSRRAKAVLPSTVVVAEVLRGSLGDPGTRDAVVAQLNLGQTVANYFGHGSVGLWRGNVLTSTDAAALRNARFPLVVSMTCLNGFFHDPREASIAEALLDAPGGAVAVWASSGLTESASQVLIDEALLRLLFPRYGAAQTLGDATLAAKAATTDMDVRTTWILFGDPSAKLK